MKFAFNCRVTVEGLVLVEADTETEAWAKAHASPQTIPKPISRRAPTYTRLPDLDEYGL